MRVTINNQEVDIAVRFMGEHTLNEEMEVMKEIRNRLKEPDMTTVVKSNNKDEWWDYYYECTKCKEMFMTNEIHFCPNCGAKIIIEG